MRGIGKAWNVGYTRLHCAALHCAAGRFFLVRLAIVFSLSLSFSLSQHAQRIPLIRNASPLNSEQRTTTTTSTKMAITTNAEEPLNAVDRQLEKERQEKMKSRPYYTNDTAMESILEGGVPPHFRPYNHKHLALDMPVPCDDHGQIETYLKDLKAQDRLIRHVPVGRELQITMHNRWIFGHAKMMSYDLCRKIERRLLDGDDWYREEHPEWQRLQKERHEHQVRQHEAEVAAIRAAAVAAATAEAAENGGEVDLDEIEAGLDLPPRPQTPHDPRNPTMPHGPARYTTFEDSFDAMVPAIIEANQNEYPEEVSAMTVH
ncbi:hypothetical protein GQ42DRAFT_30430 [Ramicandelaber brevisporus]|nr:hypothetical protein GQ42DRAFT_30430 [Ramicandelaber brevisporus]